jgi:hypothetical protein
MALEMSAVAVRPDTSVMLNASDEPSTSDGAAARAAAPPSCEGSTLEASIPLGTSLVIRLVLAVAIAAPTYAYLYCFSVLGSGAATFRHAQEDDQTFWRVLSPAPRAAVFYRLASVHRPPDQRPMKKQTRLAVRPGTSRSSTS